MILRPLLLLLAACSSGGDEPPAGTDTGGGSTEGPAWEMVVEDGPGGMMLGAFSVGDTMVVVGGQLNDGTGTVWTLKDDTLCVEEEISDAPLWWVHGRSDTDYYMVGEEGVIVHEVEGTRVREDVPTSAKLFGVYDDGVDVWAVGGDIFGDGTGEIWRRVDGEWSLASTTPGLAFKVWEGWVVGDGFAWFWDGSSFEDRTPPGDPRFTTVRGRGPDDVWVVGGTQVAELFHWDGSGWEQPELDPACINAALNGVYTAPGEDVFVAGMFGVAARYDGTSWACAGQPMTAKAFHAVWAHGGAWWALGGNFTSSSTQVSSVARFGEGPLPEVQGTCGEDG